MLTKYIIEAIQDGYSSDYLSLLHNYGLWARYFGAVGYHCPATAHEDYIIDDESALIVEACMCWLKQTRPQVYKLFSMYYIRGLDEYDILSVLKERVTVKRVRHKDRYDATPYDDAVRYLTGSAVRDIIILGEKLVLDYLQKEVKHENV
nr:MAG TPA: DNA-directed RNA polymerase subunit alpha [Caudoviricetes sp.]